MSALLAPAISLAGLTAYRTVPINWDSAILLDCGRQILQGAVPYVDYVESNPPLSHYLHTLPVLLARWTGLGLPDAFQWWTLGLTACSAAALWMILGRDPLLGRSYKHRGIVVGAWVCFSLSLLATDDFGQREHLFMLGFAPWLLFRLQFCDEPTRHWRLALVAAGLLAPLALLKPYFAALIVVIEAWLVLRTRRWSDLLRLDLLIMSLVGLAYAAHFLLVPAAMREAFFGRWVPFIAAHYAVYDCTWKELWLNHRAAPPAIVALSGLALSRSLPPPLRLRFETFAVAIIAAWATYCMQGKDWSYHLIPPRGLAFLFTSIQIVTVADRAGHEWSAGIVPRGVRNPLLWAAAGIGVVLASFMFTTIARTHGELEWQRVRPTVEGINTNSMSDEFITFISTDVGVAYPALIYSGRPAGTRYLCAFPIAMFYMNTRAIRGRPFPYHPPEESSAQEKLFLSELGDDVSTRRPRLVIVPNSHSQACPIGFVIDEYLHETGWFRRFMGDYDLLARSNEMSVYARRRPDQHVEASSDEFLALPRFAQQPPGHHEPGTAPVGLLDGALPSGSPPGRKILME